MARRKSRWVGAETGKSRTTTKLSGLIINLGGVDFVQQEYSVKALVTYEWDSGCPATEFDPGYESVFNVTKILPEKQITLVDERHSLNIRAWAWIDILPYLTEECILRLDAQVEGELKDFARDDF